MAEALLGCCLSHRDKHVDMCLISVGPSNAEVY